MEKPLLHPDLDGNSSTLLVQRLGLEKQWSQSAKLPCDIGGAKKPGMMYFPTK